MNFFKLLISFVLGCGLIACSDTNISKEKSIISNTETILISSKQNDNIGIISTVPTWKESANLLNVNGIIDVPPGNKSYVSLPYGGFIKKVNVLEGKRITKGELLFEVENPEILALQQEYLEWDGKLEFLEGELSRQLKLSSENATSTKNVQAARAELNVANAKLKGLKARLKLANVDIQSLKNGNISETQRIVAPFNGVVTKITAAVGAYVTPQDKLMELIDLKHAHAELTVFEKDIPFLTIGQTVDIQFVNSPTPVQAEVYLIGGEISQDRSVKVHCHFLKENKFAIPGSFFQAKIHVAARNALTLPESAFISHGKHRCIFEQVSQFEFKLVKVRVLGQGQSEIPFELIVDKFNGQKFVTKGAFELYSILNKSSE